MLVPPKGRTDRASMRAARVKEPAASETTSPESCECGWKEEEEENEVCKRRSIEREGAFMAEPCIMRTVGEGVKGVHLQDIGVRQHQVRALRAREAGEAAVLHPRRRVQGLVA